MTKYMLEIADGTRIHTDSIPTSALVEAVHADGRAEAWEHNGAWRLVFMDKGHGYYAKAVAVAPKVLVTAVWKNA